MAGSSNPDYSVTASDTRADTSICPQCAGVGWLRRDVPLGHPDFGRPMPCRCKVQEFKQQSVERLHAMSRLGDQLRSMTFETFLTRGIPYDTDDLRGKWTVEEVDRSLSQAWKHARSFAADLHGWFVLLGDFGCGKTHLAVAIANERIAHGEPALFQVVPDLLDHLRATFAPTSSVTYDDLFEEVRTAPLLILDDLGAQSNSPWAEEKLFQIINYRYNYRLPTVITSNVALDRHHPRLASRITDMGQPVYIKAPDFRGGIQASRPPTGKMPPSLRRRS